MKRIMVISDTHMPKYGSVIPKILVDEMKGIDFIIHAGDFQSYDVYEKFKSLKPIIACFGNNDCLKLKEILPRKAIFTVEGIKIGLFHGHGISIGVKKTTNSLNRAKLEFLNDDVNLVIFGHSHKATLEVINGKTYFNPGSPTNKRTYPRYSYGILAIDNNNFTLNHYFFDKVNN